MSIIGQVERIEFIFTRYKRGSGPVVVCIINPQFIISCIIDVDSTGTGVSITSITAIRPEAILTRGKAICPHYLQRDPPSGTPTTVSCSPHIGFAFSATPICLDVATASEMGCFYPDGPSGTTSIGPIGAGATIVSIGRNNAIKNQCVGNHQMNSSPSFATSTPPTPKFYWLVRITIRISNIQFAAVNATGTVPPWEAPLRADDDAPGPVPGSLPHPSAEIVAYSSTIILSAVITVVPANSSVAPLVTTKVFSTTCVSFHNIFSSTTTLESSTKIDTVSDNTPSDTVINCVPDDGWTGYLAARRYHDGVRRNRLIEQPELIPDKLARVRALVRLGYGTPHYETEAIVERILGS